MLELVALSDDYRELCTGLAGVAGVAVRTHSSLEVSLAPAPGSLGTLVLAAGHEAGVLRSLAGARVETELAVVGTGLPPEVAAGLAGAGARAVFDLPRDVGELRAWIERRVHALAAEAQRRAHVDRQAARFAPARLVGRSATMRAALAAAALAAERVDVPVLLVGEPGTGKRHLARTIHYAGARRAAPLVWLDCAATPPEALEVELFGQERGARPGAQLSRAGLLEAIGPGTVYLGAVERLGPSLLERLFRAVAERRVRRVGGDREMETEARVMVGAAPAAAAEQLARWRALGAECIPLPPLRERGDDAVLLAEAALADDPQWQGAAQLPEEVRAAILARAWPGNVAELKHAVQRAVALGGGRLRAEDLASAGAAGGGRGDGSR